MSTFGAIFCARLISVKKVPVGVFVTTYRGAFIGVLFFTFLSFVIKCVSFFVCSRVIVESNMVVFT
jgi:hypothetical protein